MKNEAYPHLFEPIQINSLRFPNRIVIAPMGNGVPEICNEFGQSGASLMTLGSWQIDDEYSQLMGYPSPYEKPKGQQVHGLEGRKMLKQQMVALQRYGMYASIELLHAGRYAHNFPKESGKEGTAIGPIDEVYRHKKGYDIHVKGMDEAMIEHVAENYAKAARFHQQFGFDMIMLHFAHGWLPYQFLSPLFNQRTDQYGGSLENRMRFPLMILQKVRKAVGPDFPIELRVGAKEFREGGFDVEECIKFVQAAQSYVDLIHVSAGLDSEPELFHHCVSKGFKPHLDKIELVRQIKQATNKPVVLVGSVILPEEAEYAIASGACDIVALGREAMVDPDWVKKAKANRGEDIYPCLRCSSCSEQHGMGCASNPRYNQYSYVKKELEPAKHKKKVIVVGGGPAGMRAAITSAQRGHEVILLEKESRLGGQIKNFAQDPYKVDLDIFYKFLVNQMKKYPIDVRLNTMATKELVESMHPDVVFTAIGSKPKVMHFKGEETTKIHIMQMIDVYERPKEVKGNVLIVGGGACGIETGIYLAHEGHKTYVSEITDTIAAAEEDINWRSQMEWILNQVDCTPLTNCTVIELEEHRVVLKQEDKTFRLDIDTLILSIGFTPRQKEADEFYDTCDTVYKIGDCYKVRKLSNATNEGYFRALQIGEDYD